MSLKPVTPMFPALSSAEVRAHLRRIDDDESNLIDGYMLASQDDIEIQCERAITVRKYRLQLPAFPNGSYAHVGPLPFDREEYCKYTNGSAILLNQVPVRKIESITYFDGLNASQSYTAQALFDNEPAELRQQLDTNWPATYSRRDAVTIEFWAGHIVPITLVAADDKFTSPSGYQFINGDTVTISASGNNNAVLGDVAVLPVGVTRRQTYYVVNSTSSGFQIASSVGGAALSLAEPSATGEVIDLLFAGEIEPYQRLALFQMTAKAFGERCPQGGCVCTAEDFESNPMLRRLKWRSCVEFYG